MNATPSATRSRSHLDPYSIKRSRNEKRTPIQQLRRRDTARPFPRVAYRLSPCREGWSTCAACRAVTAGSFQRSAALANVPQRCRFFRSTLREQGEKNVTFSRIVPCAWRLSAPPFYASAPLASCPGTLATFSPGGRRDIKTKAIAHTTMP